MRGDTPAQRRDEFTERPMTDSGLRSRQSAPRSWAAGVLHRRRTPRATRRASVAGLLTFALIGIGGGLAFAAGPSISLTAPHTVAAGSKYTIKVSGYFNCTKKNLRTGSCGNVAEVDEYPGSFTCTATAIHRRRGSATFVAGGSADRKLRARTPTSPGHFSATEQVESPKTGGQYTLCAFLRSYPIGGMPKQQMATAHIAVNGPPPTPHYTLTISIVGSGEVKTSAVAPYTIDCRSSDSPCSKAFTVGATLDVFPSGDSLARFAHWSGACSGTDPDCKVTMDSDKTLTATFNAGS